MRVAVVLLMTEIVVAALVDHLVAGHVGEDGVVLRAKRAGLPQAVERAPERGEDHVGVQVKVAADVARHEAVRVGGLVRLVRVVQDV